MVHECMKFEKKTLKSSFFFTIFIVRLWKRDKNCIISWLLQSGKLISFSPKAIYCCQLFLELVSLAFLDVSSRFFSLLTTSIWLFPRPTNNSKRRNKSLGGGAFKSCRIFLFVLKNIPTSAHSCPCKSSRIRFTFEDLQFSSSPTYVALLVRA